VARVSVMGYRCRLRGPVLALWAVSGLAAGADRTHTLAQAMAAAVSQGQPTITILPAASGAPLQSHSGGSASLSFGRAAYYGGPRAPGVVAHKKINSLVLSTRFALKVGCSGWSSFVEVTMSLFTMDPSYTVSVDGAELTTAPSVTVLPCGSLSEHRMDVEVNTTRPAGPIGSTVSFSAAAKY
jgi:hypothetical protein